MIYSAAGMPSRFSEWCESILHDLVVAAAGEPAQFMADRLEQAATALLASRKAAGLLVARQPQRALAEALAAAPFMLCLDAPEHAVRSLISDYGAGFADAVRRTSNAITALLPLAGSEHALVLRAAVEREPHDLARDIARHFGLPPDDAAIRRANETSRYPSADESRRSAIESALDDALLARGAIAARFGFGDEDRCTAEAIVAAALDPLWAHLNGKPLKDIFWHPALFVRADDSAHAPILAVDATGSARCLAYGPYIQLPEGAWRCNLLLGTAESAVGLHVVADVFAGVSLNTIEFAITEQGLLEIEMSFVNPSPDNPIEVRLFSTRAAFEGEIMLGGVRLVPQRARIVRHA